ncbi:hypothetical protein OEG84_23645 [Hoeflea sp. G2-23]|uniref:Uncharacterized protein n=1 Tax=Hoeflea algicola TaxID=2983763 RepID=A0ABT3ZFM4_9HYPH|nr:hypothetical protein [Hoeflea algicola]MCY0150615.1 hypothetical protein [Hoeflea algicola]
MFSAVFQTPFNQSYSLSPITSDHGVCGGIAAALLNFPETSLLAIHIE